MKLEGTHRVQTHTVLLLNLITTSDLSTKTLPLVGYPTVIPCTKFEHFGIIRFLVMLRTNRQTDGLENPTDDDRTTSDDNKQKPQRSAHDESHKQLLNEWFI